MDLLRLLAVLFICVGVGTLWKQSRARHCPVHNRNAGTVAVFIAYLSLAIGVVLLLLAVTGPLAWTQE